MNRISMAFALAASFVAFGLFYHFAGIARGIDLSTVLRYANQN